MSQSAELLAKLSPRTVADRTFVAMSFGHGPRGWWEPVSLVRMARGWLVLMLLWLAGNDLRLTLLAVPPVLPLIHAELGLDEKGVAALSGLRRSCCSGSRRCRLIADRAGGSAAGAHPGAVPDRVRVSAARRRLVDPDPVRHDPAHGRGHRHQPADVSGAGTAVVHQNAVITRATGFWSNGLLVGELLERVAHPPAGLAVGRQLGGQLRRLVGARDRDRRPGAARHAARSARGGRAAPAAGMPDWRSTRMWHSAYCKPRRA